MSLFDIESHHVWAGPYGRLQSPKTMKCEIRGKISVDCVYVMPIRIRIKIFRNEKTLNKKQINLVSTQNLLLQFYMSHRKRYEHFITDDRISIFVSQDLD